MLSLVGISRGKEGSLFWYSIGGGVAEENLMGPIDRGSTSPGAGLQRP